MDDTFYSKMISCIKDGRGEWESVWQDIALVCNTENAVFNTTQSPGEQRQRKIYDSTATIAVNRSGAALSGLITPKGQTWHGISTDNEEINKDHSVRIFFDQVTRLLFDLRYSPYSGFAGANNQIFRNLMAFGTAPMFVDELPSGRGCRYRSLFLGKTYVKANAWGMIDRFVREFEMTTKEAQQEFENLPDCVTSSQDEQKHTFYHLCWPNPDYDPKSSNPSQRQYKYVYLTANDLNTPFEEGGYYEFPMPVARDIPSPGETYGRSPAMHVLPEIRMLQAMRKTSIKSFHKLVSPPLLAESQAQFTTAGLASRLQVNLNPGGITFGGVNSQGQQLIRPLQTGGDPNTALEAIKDSRTAINDAFLINLFQVLVETPSMTATEVLARTQERGILLAPVGAQIETGYLSVMIEREIGIYQRQGLLPDLPGVLNEAGGEYSIIYNSPLTRAQRSEEVNAISQLTQFASQAASYDPEILDWINWQQCLKTYQEVLGAPESVINSKEVVQQIQQARQNAQQQQNIVEQAPALAGAAKDLSQAGLMQSQQGV